MRICDVAVIPPLPDRDVLSYAAPDPLASRIREGMRVLVPLGQREVTGIVLAVGSEPPAHGSLREILDVPDEGPILDRELLELCRFAARYYMASLAEVVATAVLADLRAKSRRLVRLTDRGRLESASSRLGARERELLERLSRVRVQSVSSLTRSAGAGASDSLRRLADRGLVEILEEGPRACPGIRTETVYRLAAEPSPAQLESLARRAPRQHRCLLALREAGSQGRTLRDLGGEACREALRALADRGWVRIERREVDRGTLQPEPTPTPPPLVAAQEAACRAIEEAVRAGRFETFLLWGVTGSGKTEVYLRAARSALERGRGVLFLVPEIGLTEHLLSRVLGRFGSAVAVLHSGLSPGERWNQWRRLARREARILVGARSAVFAPLPDLGLVIVDEEHDGAYKQEEALRYNARDLAVVRARIASCPVVLGSATPSIESYWNALSGRYRRLDLPERIERRPLPAVDLIDLRREPPEGEPAIFSRRLRDAIAENRAAGNQTLLFLNRRGFAHYLQCTVCGHTIGCPNCSVTLTFHLRDRSLRCHHCDHRVAAPDLCPECTSPALRDIGFGTEQVEAAVRSLLPGARIARLDRDTTRRRGAQRDILEAWRREEIDVLVGTQMVTKGHDIPGVTLVGVVLADPALNLPDFRAAERTFQLLTQVAGRAGRGPRAGRVLVQTYRPDHYALRLAAAQDFEQFAEREVRAREALGYPPFGRLVNVRFDGLDPTRVEAAARCFARELRSANPHSPRARRVQILGPAPAPLERLRGRYRWQLLLKGPDAKTLRATILPVVQEARRRASRGVRIAIDVDPYDLL
jgi:primosomal protein N' (replication factor Y)